MTPYRDGTLLVESYDYEQPGTAGLVVYDPADESVEPCGEVAIEEYSPLQGLAYDADTDTIYCSKGGEICPVDLQAGEIGAGITDMPLETYGGASACVLRAATMPICSDGAVIRNLDPAQQGPDPAEDQRQHLERQRHQRLLPLCQRPRRRERGALPRLTETQNLLENMMNRDDSIDVYVMNTSSSIYDALYRRGYLMELDGSEKLMALADRMYPQLREAVSAGGHLVALPVTFNSWTLGVNEKALEALGMTLDDVPDNWMDLLAFIANLEQPLKEHPNVHLFYAGYTAREARNDLFNSIFEDYSRYINANDPAMGYNTELLRGLLAKLEQIDFVALVCAEDSEDDGERGDRYMDYGEDSMLLQLGTGCTIGNFYSDFTPLLMGLDADTPMPLVLRADVAVVNPFTRHPEMAMAFMEELADSLSTSTRYCLDPSLNEPIRGEQNEESAADAQEWLEELNGELEEADAADQADDGGDHGAMAGEPGVLGELRLGCVPAGDRLVPRPRRQHGHGGRELAVCRRQRRGLGPDQPVPRPQHQPGRDAHRHRPQGADDADGGELSDAFGESRGHR